MSRERGFTIIELLVVMSIIGILAAFAVQSLTLNRRQGFDARAKSDIRSMAAAQEAYFADFQIYKSCNTGSCATLLPGMSKLSDGVSLTVTGTATGFEATAAHPGGTGVVYSWLSQAGGLQ